MTITERTDYERMVDGLLRAESDGKLTIKGKDTGDEHVPGQEDQALIDMAEFLLVCLGLNEE